MTHQNNDTSQIFDPKKFFNKARRIYIEEPLKEFGFKRYKTSVLARLTTGNVFQFLDFQKSAYGGQQFTINVAIRPLFCSNHDYLTLLPGNRLGSMSTNSKKDKWWNYSNEENGEKGFKEVYTLIEQYAIPFFNATQLSKDIIKSYERNLFGFSKFGNRIGWGTVGWENFDFGHIYLAEGNKTKAIKNFKACYKIFSKDENEICSQAAIQSKKVIEIIDKGQTFIDDYLEQTILNSKTNLKLPDW